MTQAEVLERVINTLPAPPITDIDLSRPDAVRFNWLGHRFRVQLGYIQAEEVVGITLERNALARLMTELIQREV